MFDPAYTFDFIGHSHLMYHSEEFPNFLGLWIIGAIIILAVIQSKKVNYSCSFF